MAGPTQVPRRGFYCEKPAAESVVADPLAEMDAGSGRD